jgi:hypothetical protein
MLSTTSSSRTEPSGVPTLERETPSNRKAEDGADIDAEYDEQ